MKDEYLDGKYETIESQEAPNYFGTLAYGQRAPTKSETREIQRKFGMEHIETSFVQYVIINSARIFFSHTNQLTSNAKHRLYSDVLRQTNALLKTLGERVKMEMIDIEPLGIRKILFQLRENTTIHIKNIQPEVNHHQKQRRRTKKGTDSLIIHLTDHLNLFQIHPKSVYTQDPITNFYSGEFFEFVKEVCQVSGIEIADQTLGNYIKALHIKGSIVFSSPPDKPDQDI